MFDEIIDNYKDQLIDTLKTTISYPSVSDETSTDPNMPFGKACSDVLDYVLKLGESFGFRSKNIDGYCGYLEFGEGEELVGIIGHLDVVPADTNDGWTTPPFEASIRDGKLFGRGSIDDKGPVIASLYAMKVIHDNCKINKRVRLILGLNEEKSWKCINHYKEVEEWPTIGFSPDANFPAIYAEKGIISIELQNKFLINGFDILDINCNNNAINVVPKYASITLKSNFEASSFFNRLITNNKDNNSLKINLINDSQIKIEAFGVASHAAHPEMGVNAIKILSKFIIDNFELNSCYLKYLYDHDFFNEISPKFITENTLEDESGVLTSNVAVIDYDKTSNNLIFKINLRVPVNTKLDFIVSRYESLKENFKDLKVLNYGHQEPLYVEKDSYLVKTLVDIFNKKTGLNANPVAIGGGTYARAFKNVISYGANFPEDKDMCHQVDEYCYVDKLITSSKIYAEAIYELAK